ncbi:MAG: hypothetical protein NC543_13970 [bacterium]|nr:hypothetical protein [bacterium]MCM1376451.1 hypothetical protein [Muribaculum sp.]
MLWDLYLQGLLPDGYRLYHAGTEHARDNSYAILDRDGDGRRLYNNEQTVDGDEYESWRQSYLDQAERITVPFQQLTEENIAALGYPKPDIPIQMSED